MNKVQLSDRIAEIEKAIKGLEDQYKTYLGQVSEAKHWLATLEKAEAEAAVTAVEPAPEVTGEVV